MGAGSLVLHSYWRSGTSYRTRIALGLKGLDFAQVCHDLRKGAHKEAGFLALNPQGLVPALETDEGVLTQSVAILEWLEETYPEPALLPSGAHDRALVRAMAAVVGCDIHPINNLRVLDCLKRSFGADGDGVNAWIARWVVEGFTALESMIAVHGGDFCFGNQIGLADCYLVPQVYAARRFGVNIEDFRHIQRVVAHAQSVPAVAAAHPDRQPDADLVG